MPRLRVRTLLIVVALVTVGLALVAGAWRRASYRAESERHARLAREYKHRQMLFLAESASPDPESSPESWIAYSGWRSITYSTRDVRKTGNIV